LGGEGRRSPISDARDAEDFVPTREGKMEGAGSIRPTLNS
jgi:hypothetical protein